MNTDVSTLSDAGLKALGYDNIVDKERVENNLLLINQEIARRAGVIEQSGETVTDKKSDKKA